MNRLKFLHGVWRVCTALLVIGLALLTSFILFPYLDRRLPLFPVIFIIYILIAYFLMPLILRFWRLVIRPTHIPRYVITGDGWPSEPVNIAIVARNRRHLEKAMRTAGWYKADRLTFLTGIRELYAMITDTAYPTAPFTNLYLFGRKHDVGYQIPHSKSLSPRQRHHVRFWRLTEMPTQDTDDHFTYWRSRIKRLFGKETTIWIGAATNEPSLLGLRWRDLQLTHGNDGNPDGERDYIIETLRKKGFVKETHTIKDGEPFTMRAQNLGTNFIVDGYIKVVELHTPLVSRIKKSIVPKK